MPHRGNFPTVGYPRPLIVRAFECVPENDTLQWSVYWSGLQNRIVLTGQTFYAPVNLPQGVTVTKLTLCGYRDDALATMRVRLYKRAHGGMEQTMAEVIADWITMDSKGSDDTISFPVIDNINNNHYIGVYLSPNDAVGDVCFCQAEIDWK